MVSLGHFADKRLGSIE